MNIHFFRGIVRGGATGAKSPLGPVKSIYFRGLSGGAL